MRNACLRFFDTDTYLDNVAVALMHINHAQTFRAGNSHTVYWGETFTVNKAGIFIQKILFCIQWTLFTF